MSSPPPAYPPPYAAQPPPLPPRQSEPSMTAMAAHDPRSSSQQSLVPVAGADNGRRTLMLVYLHGFMGDETSFQSFPAHLHNLLTITMAESHVVHSKIYPKYRSRYALEVARDDFSHWLTPHETPLTDIVLLGHSMGGLLAADIALLFRHNIIGVINFDVPFLGMHPGIVKAGLGSIFNPWPGPENAPAEEPGEVKRPSRMNTLFNPRPTDPNYNPNFHNDVHLPVRKGWENALHFMNKHSNALFAAGKGLVKSHIQFGGAMADYPRLKARYARIRALEEADEDRRRPANPEVRHPPRIRFVNYYTASTGRPKKPKSPSPSRPASRGSNRTSDAMGAPVPGSQLTLTTTTDTQAVTTSPRISVDEYREDEVVPVSPEEPLSAAEPIPLPQTPEEETPPVSRPAVQTAPDLPEIPPIPQEPPFVDIAQYSDKSQRKAAEKEHDRALKEYQRAVKARNKIIKERTRIQEKWEKEQVHKQKQERGKPKPERPSSGHQRESLEGYFSVMDIAAQNPPDRTPPVDPQPDANPDGPYSNYTFSHSAILAQPSPDSQTPATTPGTPSTATTSYTESTRSHDPHKEHSESSPSEVPPKKKRYKKFCMLPPKDNFGNKDPTWVRVFMENMDEVVAHTSLFFMSETYERLVGEVADRIEEWVKETETERLVRELGAWEAGDREWAGGAGQSTGVC